MTKVLIVDDHAFLRTGIELLLSKAGLAVVGSVGGGEAALALVPDADPDVIILDIRMPGMNGVEFLQQLRARGDWRGVVVLATDIDDAELVALIEGYADAILFKSCSDEDLLDAIATVAAGKVLIERQLVHRARQAAMTRNPVWRTTLSPREREIVGLIKDGFKNEEIAQRLGIKVGSVKVHVHNILGKTGALSRKALHVMEFVELTD